jgi:isopenicillin N synthase-like dioxygenase
MDQVPILDIGLLMSLKDDEEIKQNQSQLEALKNQLDQAASEWGFFYIQNHGLNKEEIEIFQQKMKLFFKLPKQIKKQIKRFEKNSRGYFDDELTKNQIDWKEGFDFAGKQENKQQQLKSYDNTTINTITTANTATSNLIVRMEEDQNQWLSDEIVPGFQKEMEDYFLKMEHLSRRIMMLFARILNKPIFFFDDFFRKPLSSSFLRLNYYPIATEPTKTMAVHHHTDAGALTILLQDQHVTSLQVFHRFTKKWHLIPPRQDTFVINIGDMLQVWSNDRFHAPLHRVLANDQAERFSAPFFYNPSYSSLVEPIFDHSKESKPKYRPIKWYDFRLKRFQGDYADLGEEIQIKHYHLHKGDMNINTSIKLS